MQYAYDLAGRVVKVLYPDNTEARLTYDAAGRVSTVTDANSLAYAAYTYAPPRAGRPAGGAIRSAMTIAG